MSKKAIVTVSYGSSSLSAISKGIEPVEDRLREVFHDHDVFRAFSSLRIIGQLRVQEGVTVPDVDACLEELYQDGYEEIIVQPLLLIAGREFEKVSEATLKAQNVHQNIIYRLGRPLLFDKTDYDKVVDALRSHLNEELAENKAAVFAGRGSSHMETETYTRMERHLRAWDGGVHMALPEGNLSIRKVADSLEERGIRQVLLYPFTLVAGEQAQLDMPGGDHTQRNYLEARGFKVEERMEGLGSISGIQDCFVSRVVAAMPRSGKQEKTEV